ncbi:GTP pyrophosphokinase family protein [Cellulosimicrobium cellulans]|uniref:GTP pyrophosphokinase n=1 Tax=Cellulosimicrobium cellulans TaxID=1710 RepID=UPI00130DBA59|nr:RelA/SpoT domain-containing protein [Cellulosimicrobium cellulans]
MADVVDLVAVAYRERMRAWQDAQNQVAAWLDRECARLLTREDRSRLRVEPGRIKDPARAIDKVKRKQAEDADLRLGSADDVEGALKDIVGVKVLCKSTRDQRLLCERLDECATTLAGIERVDARDYASHAKESGYRAAHHIYRVSVTGEAPVFVEVQIKTRLQDAWGELTHEDLYKPGTAIKVSDFHRSVARTMANLLAEVDRLADDLAEEVANNTDQVSEAQVCEAAEPRAGSADGTAEVRVRTTGPRYAFAVDDNGVQGLIPAYAVRALLDTDELIDVNDHVRVDDLLTVRVAENERGVYYVPLALAGHATT